MSVEHTGYWSAFYDRLWATCSLPSVAGIIDWVWAKVWEIEVEDLRYMVQYEIKAFDSVQAEGPVPS